VVIRTRVYTLVHSQYTDNHIAAGRFFHVVTSPQPKVFFYTFVTVIDNLLSSSSSCQLPRCPSGLLGKLCCPLQFIIISSFLSPSNVDCNWHIVAATDYVIRLEVQATIAGSGTCGKDSFTIYDG
jgi:hypothetical protein